MKDQRRETRGRKPRLYPYQGRQVTLAELAEISGWNVETLRKRINDGMTPDEAVNPTSRKRPPPTPDPVIISYQGEERTLTEWAKLKGMSRQKLYARLFHDPVWTKEEASGDSPRRRPDKRRP